MKIYNLNEITDSRILYDKNPPKFMLMLITLIMILLIGFICWSAYSIKTYVVKGQGIVTSQNKQYIMSPVSGSIEEIHVDEGKKVKKGDVLLSLKAVQSNLQTEQINGQLEYLNERINLLARAQKDVSRGTNNFDETKNSELEFFNKLNALQVKKKEFEVNKVTENSLKEQNYNEEQIKDYKNKAKNKAEQLKYETLLEINNETKQLEMEVNKLNTQKNALLKSVEEYKVVATSDGTFHLSNQLTMGMVLQAGTSIGSLIEDNDDLIIELNLPSAERAKVHKNDDVEIVVAGLNQSEYGTIEGKVISIAKDAIIDEKKDTNNIFFKVQIKLNKTYLRDKNDNIVNLTLGMLTEIRVKYEKITYLQYMLEQIGFK